LVVFPSSDFQVVVFDSFLENFVGEGIGADVVDEFSESENEFVDGKEDEGVLLEYASEVLLQSFLFFYLVDEHA
jgi:hypothetical protein